MSNRFVSFFVYFDKNSKNYIKEYNNLSLKFSCDYTFITDPTIWELNESRSHRFCASLITFRVIPCKSWLFFRFSFRSSFYFLHILFSVQFYFPKNNSNLYPIVLSNTCIHNCATPTTWTHRQGEQKNTFS